MTSPDHSGQRPLRPPAMSTRTVEAAAGSFAPGDPLLPLERRASSALPSTRRSLLSRASLIVVSQLVLGAVGIGSLPILARNFGRGAYNDFSLFGTLLGVVTYQGFARALLVAAMARRDARPEEIGALARASVIAIVALAACVGALVLSPLSAGLL